MTEPPTWPPPPNAPAPLSEHDDFLADCIRNWKPEQIILRSQLTGKMCEKTGLKYNSCLPIVNNFCDRHAILVPTHGLVVWSSILLPVVMMALRGVMDYVLEQRRDAVITHMERVVMIAEKQYLDTLFWYIYAIVAVVGLVLAFFRNKKMRREAAEAKTKFV